MGLCRDFFLYAEHKDGVPIYAPNLSDAIMESVEQKSGYTWDGFLEDREAATLNEVNWYDWDSDMRSVSKQFPDILFTLHCDGMSIDDTWDAGFCDGRSDFQCAYIPELNRTYLTTGEEADPTENEVR